jgi:xanthine dehydrogenase accessory factor
MCGDKNDLFAGYTAGKTFDITFRVPGEPEQKVYVRRFQSPVRLIILGGGYVAQSLCRFASALEFDIAVADDRPVFANTEVFPQAKNVLCDTFPDAIAKLRITDRDYVAVVTRGHKHDADCLRIILRGNMPEYLGLIGSKRRVRGLFDMLTDEGFSKELLERIHTPIGLPIGAVTPDEIAISILAELIQCRSRRMLSRGGEILEQTNVDPSFLGYLSSSEEKAVAVVVERRGSTPVRTGAIMAVNRLGQTFGTVGGGCGEHEVVTAALRVLRTGKNELITVDMTNDIAENEGMVCGGKMHVYICRGEEMFAGNYGAART